MTRRNWLSTFISGVLGSIGLVRGSEADSKPAIDAGRHYEKQMFKNTFGKEQMNNVVFDHARFGFEVIETTGTEALAEWEKLKSAGRGVPVIVGSDEDVTGIMEGWDPKVRPDAASTLAKADKLWPAFDIKVMREAESEIFRAEMKAEGKELSEYDLDELPEAGDWPEKADSLNGPTIVNEVLSGKPHARVYVALIPSKESYEIPAYFGWGGWNANPVAEQHVVMLRKWHEKYGAELVGITGDVMNLRVSKQPATREEAIKLAEEMFHYCEDIVTQGTGDLAALAAMLMVSDYWYFWWD
jgi:Domain of unknown function (DUF4253)